MKTKTHIHLNKIVAALLLLVAQYAVKAQYYSSSATEFGQNRVQYHTFFWQSYNFERFKIYFNAGGENHAVYTAKAANLYIREVEKIMNYTFDEKVEFIVFNNQSQFKESNIGLTNESETNIGGTTKIAGNKIFIYFDGRHEQLNRQIRSGLGQLIAYKLIYGDNWREAIKTSTVMAIPSWFTNGFVRYMEGGWNTDIDNKVKDLLKSGKINSINQLEGETANVVGLALWNYVAEVYGEKVIPNILYMTRLSRNVENGFLYVLGTPMASLTKEFKAYYNARYDSDLMNRQLPADGKLGIRSKKKYSYHNFKLSPDEKFATFTTNELGRYKLWLFDVEKNTEKQLAHFEKYTAKKEAFDQKENEKTASKEDYKTRAYKGYKQPNYKAKKILKGDHKLDRLPDLSQPIVAWHPTGDYLAFVSETKGDLLFTIYEMESGKATPKIIPKLNKVLDMSYDAEGKRLAMSAVANGQSDIYIYNVIGGNTIQLTNDPFDDMYAQFVDKDSKIIFSSNRIDDTIRKNVDIKLYPTSFDVFTLDVKKPTKPLQRITNTPYVDERFPSQYDKSRYTFLSDENGIYNRHIAYYDSTISHIDTTVHYRYFSVEDRLSNYPYSALEYDVNAIKDFYTLLFRMDGKYVFYKGQPSKDFTFDEISAPTKFKEISNKSLPVTTVPVNVNVIEDKLFNDTLPFRVDINNYVFESDSNELKKPIVLEPSTSEVPIDKFKKNDSLWDKFELPRQDIYTINFSTDYVVSQFDYNFLNNTYQRITPGGYVNPGLNSVINLGAVDVFEDYKIVGGFRVPLTFDNTEYLIGFENLKNRLDKKFMVSRRSFTNKDRFRAERIQTYEGRYTMKYPFSEVSSIRLTGNVRYDRNIQLSTESSSLFADDVLNYLGGLKVEYVFDNTRVIGLNILNGTRFKVWGEGMHELNKRQTDFFTFGFDFRHYQKIHRSIVFASRVAASTSVGSQKLVYFMGGVDNWIGARFDPSIQIDPNQNYQFQTIATPMRGFFQNARNGNNFALINNELRVPIFKYLAKNPIKSDFINNFMIVGFADVGTAWTGPNPYDIDNSFNVIIIDGKNYEIAIENQKEPIIYSYGGGLRSRLFGYYLKFDLAWGVDDGTVLKPIRHFSIALDF